MMLTGITQPDADRMIARVAAHLPVGASLGRIVGVTDHAIMTRDDSGLETVWSVRRADLLGARQLRGARLLPGDAVRQVRRRARPLRRRVAVRLRVGAAVLRMGDRGGIARNPNG
jgi:hypothetical protein